MQKLLVITIAVLMAIAPAAAGKKGKGGYKDKHYSGDGPGRRESMRAMWKELDLSDAQKKKIKNIKTGLEKQKIKTVSEIKILEIDARDEITKIDADKDKVMAIMGKIMTLKKQLETAKLDALFKVRKELTKNSWKKS